ncbi:hypothetical protein LM599_04255 [Candidatus Acetothermia bacterium]|jgi:formamidopyrimidine-DNA glycosylase|nr:hypothetical protein [Candidatus Acetothermia bacterium]MCI2427304.1 hypothetical protein [Candidatus Acetothermia bacterium]MCI2428082.1 hypothetical protein [Candidatus Acetothermia bacterium]
MAELPQLAVLCANLQPKICDKEIIAISTCGSTAMKTTTPSIESIIGSRFIDSEHRGQFLLLKLLSGSYLVVHLTATGRLVHCRSNTRVTKATSFAITFSDHYDLRLIEDRHHKAAALYLVNYPDHVEPITNCGIEPLSTGFTAAALAQITAGRHKEIRNLLIDQRLIAGIGPIYSDEILFTAQISPVRFANTLTEKEIVTLHASICRVLTTAIAKIKCQIGDDLFVDEANEFLQIHGRAGKPCPVCSEPIAEIRYAKERICYCPCCQRSIKSGVNKVTSRK